MIFSPKLLVHPLVNWTCPRSSGMLGVMSEYEPGVDLLATVVRRRRERLGITQDDVATKFDGPSVATMNTIENAQGESYRAKTLFALDRALSWERGTSVQLLEGGGDGSYMYGFRAFTSLDEFVNHVVHELNSQTREKYDVEVTGKPEHERQRVTRAAYKPDPEIRERTAESARRLQDEESSRTGLSAHVMSVVQDNISRLPVSELIQLQATITTAITIRMGEVQHDIDLLRLVRANFENEMREAYTAQAFNESEVDRLRKLREQLGDEIDGDSERELAGRIETAREMFDKAVSRATETMERIIDVSSRLAVAEQTREQLIGALAGARRGN